MYCSRYLSLGLLSLSFLQGKFAYCKGYPYSQNEKKIFVPTCPKLQQKASNGQRTKQHRHEDQFAGLSDRQRNVGRKITPTTKGSLCSTDFPPITCAGRRRYSHLLLQCHVAEPTVDATGSIDIEAVETCYNSAYSGDGEITYQVATATMLSRTKKKRPKYRHAHTKDSFSWMLGILGGYWVIPSSVSIFCILASDNHRSQATLKTISQKRMS